VVGPLGALGEPRRGRVEEWEGRGIEALGYDLYKKERALSAGPAPSLSALIHPSAWKGDSPKFAAASSTQAIATTRTSNGAPASPLVRP
jgi:hypothetical protein